MYIGGLHLYAVDNQHRGQLHDRSIVTRRVGIEIGEFVARLHVGPVIAALVQFFHRGHDLALGRHHGLDIAPVQYIPERIYRVVAHRIGKRHGNGHVVSHDRHYAVFLRDIGRDFLDDFGIDRLSIDMAVLEPELIGHGAQDLVFANSATGNEHVKRSLVLRLHRLRRRLNLVVGQKPSLSEELKHIFIIACHCLSVL